MGKRVTHLRLVKYVGLAVGAIDGWRHIRRVGIESFQVWHGQESGCMEHQVSLRKVACPPFFL